MARKMSTTKEVFKLGRQAAAKSKKKSKAEIAVNRFENAQSELNTFMEEHEDLINELRELVEEHNATLKEAVLSVKTEAKLSTAPRHTVGSIGVRKKNNDYWDGEALISIFPPRIYNQFVERVVKYKVDADCLQRLIRVNEISEEANKAYVEKEPTIVLLPGSPKELLI